MTEPCLLSDHTLLGRGLDPVGPLWFTLAVTLLAIGIEDGFGDDLAPPPPVHTPGQQLESFRLAEPGYRIELVASDPMIQDPVAMRFDGEGRLWVVEMRGYMRDIDRKGVNDPIGRISVLEDVDGDGRMDRSTVFLDGLILPRALSIHPDGILVAENKPLWFAQDTDGDLVADRKTLVDPDYACDSIEHSANGLYRAMDNWIYNAKEGHRYRRSGDEWIREDTEERGQWGLCQDDRGRLFYNYNHSQLHADLVPPNSLTRNPNHEPTTGLSVGVTQTNAVFPIRPNRATNRGYIPDALDQQGRIKEFTSACAPLIYRGTLFPEFAGNAFVCETVGNLVKRTVVTGSGIQVSGTPAYSDRDFLASTDERFRPVWLEEGPDGAIYVADMYRGIVQDGPHMSPYLREHSIARKMDRPIHLGRIWRIVPDGFEQPERPEFSGMSGKDLVEALAHRSGWWRDQAQMHLVERDLRIAIPTLRRMALEHESPVARLQALWTLEGLRAPEPELLAPSLNDASPMVQAAVFRVLTLLGMAHGDLADEVDRRTRGDVSDEVALQMLLSLGDWEIEESRRFELMKRLLLPRAFDPLTRDAALSSLGEGEIDFLDVLWPDLPETESENPGLRFLIESLSQAVVRSRDPIAIESLLSRMGQAHLKWTHEALFSGISVYGPVLARKPVKLKAKPTLAERYPEIATYFAWPGHFPEAPKETDTKPLTENEVALFARGRQIYLTSCVACHGADGMGMKLLAPPLAGSDWVEGSEERLVRVLLHGLSGPITVSGKRYAAPEIQPMMPPLATLSNGGLAAVMTYIRREWGNKADPISGDEVNQLRIRAQGRTLPWTEAELEPFANPHQTEAP